ncbi:lycopene cyclase domain-containing protein [Sanguibacter gelidistatuariae]|uniref:Lycopene cyclase domain-containing protein n=1 Tax=Sanguibacter gelidistatuariae TaxID=1814289 RepID=A0A1G6RUN0_9MICO|nr:lycopene cyclase domain-containing protein [Sanguibacter gelidistatuariae]SDD08094.1 lycopene cyclase domain-containing protein [Sanguibacter gelidistatuariae]
MSYGQLNLVMLGVVAIAAGILAVRARVGARWWLQVALAWVVLTVLTVVFDSIMIAADLFRFDEDKLTGVTLWLAPVEDLAWPLAAALLLPAVWAWLGTRAHARTELERQR